jgi:diazepam-binding inhibitor (GABA receptor modulating acyl-CoA-binding protein)
MSDLEQQFNDAVDYVKSGQGDYTPNQEEQLTFYALYKQATEGDVSGKKPGMINVVARTKYIAWEKKQGMSKDEAMQAYVEAFNTTMK